MPTPWNPKTPGSTAQADSQYTQPTPPVVTGSRADGTALASLLTALAANKWIINNTVA